MRLKNTPWRKVSKGVKMNWMTIQKEQHLNNQSVNHYQKSKKLKAKKSKGEFLLDQTTSVFRQEKE